MLIVILIYYYYEFHMKNVVTFILQKFIIIVCLVCALKKFIRRFLSKSIFQLVDELLQNLCGCHFFHYYYVNCITDDIFKKNYISSISLSLIVLSHDDNIIFDVVVDDKIM